MSPPTPSFFGYNGGAFSFEVEQACYAAGTPMNCEVLFKNATNVVTRFGTFGQKKFQPDPDIAGVGVSCRALYSHVCDCQRDPLTCFIHLDLRCLTLPVFHDLADCVLLRPDPVFHNLADCVFLRPDRPAKMRKEQIRNILVYL